MQCVWHVLFHLILETTLWDEYNWQPHFTGGITEAQVGEVVCPSRGARIWIWEAWPQSLDYKYSIVLCIKKALTLLSAPHSEVRKSAKMEEAESLCPVERPSPCPCYAGFHMGCAGRAPSILWEGWLSRTTDSDTIWTHPDVQTPRI